jgi:hypothetical protein
MSDRTWSISWRGRLFGSRKYQVNSVLFAWEKRSLENLSNCRIKFAGLFPRRRRARVNGKGFLGGHSGSGGKSRYSSRSFTIAGARRSKSSQVRGASWLVGINVTEGDCNRCCPSHQFPIKKDRPRGAPESDTSGRPVTEADERKELNSAGSPFPVCPHRFNDKPARGAHHFTFSQKALP